MRPYSMRVIAALMSALAAIAVGVPRVADEPARPQVTGRETRDHTKSDAVGAISRGAVSGCTATLITPSVVITAEHCVRARIVGTTPNRGSMYGPVTKASDLAFSLGTWAGVFPSPETTFEAIDVAVESAVPESRGYVQLGADVALLRLKSPVTGVLPAELRQFGGHPRMTFLLPERSRDDLLPSESRNIWLLASGSKPRFAAVGYGSNANMMLNYGGTSKAASGIRTAATVSLLRLGLLYSPSGAKHAEQDAKNYYEAWTVGENGHACHGDSGGPLLTGEYDPALKRSRLVVYGVLSGGSGRDDRLERNRPEQIPNCEDPGMRNIYTIFGSKVRDFVNETLSRWNQPAMNWQERSL